MSLGFFKKNSKSKAVHRYENMPLPNAKELNKMQSRKQEAQYINVEFDDRNGRRQLAKIGEDRIQSNAYLDEPGATEGTDGGEVRQQKTTKNTKLKLKKGSRVSGGKLHRVHHIKDSDSSSSEMLESSERPDDKTKELEHYNRLKLNLTSLPQNKKLLKGIRILYGDAVSDEGRHERSLHTALGSSVLFQERQQQSQEESQNSGLEMERKLTRMYKNERHGNRLLSVTGGPISCSSLAASRSKAVSQSLSDISTMIIEERENMEPNLKTAARRPKSLSDIETARANVTQLGDISDDDSFADPPPPRKQHTGTDNSSNRHNPLTSIPVPLPTLHLQQRHGNLLHLRKQSSRGSRSSKFSSSVEAETQTTNEIVQLAPTSHELETRHHAAFYGEPCSATYNSSQVHFINAIEKVSFDHNGGFYKSETHDVTINLPKGAIKKHTVAELQVGVTLHGPFTFPDMRRPVSAIVWISLNPQVKLKKPLEITIPHFVDRSSQGELVLMKISEGGQAGKKRGNKCLQFIPVTGHNHQLGERGDQGTVSTKDTGYFCIAGDKSVLRASCCLLPVVPRISTQETWRIHYHITYLLRTCISMVEGQLGQEWEVLPPRKFSFMTTDGDKPGAMEIQFQREFPDSGWILSLESANRILMNELDLWGTSSTNMETLGMYPPRFTIRVHGEDARTSSVAIIEFLGASEELRAEVPLVRPRISTSTTSPSTPTSVFSPNPTSRNSSHSESRPISSSSKPASDTHGLGSQCTESLSDYKDYDHLPCLMEQTPHTETLTNDELFRVAAEITKVLEDKWTLLQEPLDIPDHIMLNVLTHRNTGQQVHRLLKEWRAYTGDCTKEGLVRCLHQADKRLQHIGQLLQATA